MTYKARVFENGQFVYKPCCCSDMAHAFSSGTDNEGYGALASAWDGVRFGCDLPPIQWCPWCGKVINWEWLTGPDERI